MKIFDVTSLALSRMRGWVLKARGAAVGRKVSIGFGGRFDRPETMSLGRRVTLEQHVYLKCVFSSACLCIGDGTFLGKGVEIDCQEKVEIRSHVLISPGCFITDHNHGVLRNRRIDQQPCVAGHVIIEDDVWIGANAVILPGVRLGTGAVVGAGAVVAHDVESHAIVAGVPARVIGQRGE